LFSDLRDIDASLSLGRNHAGVVLGVEYANELRVAEDGNIGVMRSEYELPFEFHAPDLRYDPIRNKGIVKIILRLIHDKRVDVIEEEKIQDGGTLLAG